MTNLLNRRQTFLLLSLINIAVVMAFANFFPVDGRNIHNEYFFFEGEEYWVSTDSILAAKRTRPMQLGEEFILSSHWLDQIAYMRMANGEETIAPYKFRILYPWLIGRIMALERFVVSLTTDSAFARRFHALDKYRLAQLNFWLCNFLCLLAATYMLYRILLHFTEDPLLIHASLALYLTQYAVFKTVSYSMVDSFSYLMFNLGLFCLLRKQYWPLGIVMVLAVLSKDSMVIWSAALLAMFLESKEKRLLWIFPLPILTFWVLRWAMGHDPLSVQYDWNLSAGEFKLTFIQAHFGSLRRILNLIFGMLFAFGILWLYLPKLRLLRQFNLAYFFVTFLVLLIAAQLLLSNRIARVLAPLYPLFLLLPIIHLSPQKNSVTGKAAPPVPGSIR